MSEKLLLFSLSILLLPACSTERIALNLATPIALTRLNTSFTKSTARNVIISVIRDEGYSGSACLFGVDLDGVLVASLDVGEIVTLYVMPGEHTIGFSSEVESNNALCALGGDGYMVRSLTGTLSPDTAHLFRMGIKQSSYGWIPILGLFAQDYGPYIEPYYQEPISPEGIRYQNAKETLYQS